MHPRAAVLTCCLGLALAACGPSDDGVPSAVESPATSSPGVATSQPPTSTPAPEPTTAPPTPTPTPTSTPEPAPPAPPGAPASATVAIADFDYLPDPVEVAVGGTITWTNQDSTAHTATVSGGPGTGAISGGSSASLTFDTAGTYEYVCQFHPGSMTGTVVVR